MTNTDSTTHTPGPWQVGNTNAIVTDIADAKYTKAVATVWTRHRDPGNPKELSDCPEGQANAHLIAAAPDLLEALKAFTDCFGSAAYAESMGFVGEYEIAMAAIAKAEGK